MADIAIDSEVYSDANLTLETLKAALRPALTILALAALLGAANIVHERGVAELERVEITQGEELSREWAWQPRAQSFDGMYRAER